MSVGDELWRIFSIVSTTGDAVRDLSEAAPRQAQFPHADILRSN